MMSREAFLCTVVSTTLSFQAGSGNRASTGYPVDESAEDWDFVKSSGWRPM